MEANNPWPLNKNCHRPAIEPPPSPPATVWCRLFSFNDGKNGQPNNQKYLLFGAKIIAIMVQLDTIMACNY